MFFRDKGSDFTGFGYCGFLQDAEYWFAFLRIRMGLSEDLDISFLLIQRCKTVKGNRNLFGFRKLFFGEWKKIKDKLFLGSIPGV